MLILKWKNTQIPSNKKGKKLSFSLKNEENRKICHN